MWLLATLLIAFLCLLSATDKQRTFGIATLVGLAAAGLFGIGPTALSIFYGFYLYLPLIFLATLALGALILQVSRIWGGSALPSRLLLVSEGKRKTETKVLHL